MGWGEVKPREIPPGGVSVTKAVALVMVAVFAETTDVAGEDVKILSGGLAFRPALLWQTCLEATGCALTPAKPMALFLGRGDELLLTKFVCLY